MSVINNLNNDNKDDELKWLKGSCHCGAVTFEVFVNEPIDVYKCNCSICWMKQNHHFVVKHQHFKTTNGIDISTLQNEYTFGTKAAKHYSCKNCGICSFYQPRSNPSGYAITIYCMERYNGNVAQENKLKLNWHEFDGIHWEEQIKSSSIVAKSE